jgi:CheY-like chemotaxis protein
VLVAEDHEDSRCLFRYFLESRGYRVVEAGDGLEAVAAAERERPDLVVMDASLPVLDGFEATRRLRAQEPSRGLPIVMVSGYATPADRENALAAGCSDYLTKPLELEQLARVLERLLGPRSVLYRRSEVGESPYLRDDQCDVIMLRRFALPLQHAGDNFFDQLPSREARRLNDD